MTVFRLWKADESTNYEPEPAGVVTVTGGRVVVDGASPEVAGVVEAIGQEPTLSLMTGKRDGSRHALVRREIEADAPEWGFAVGDEAARRTGLEVTYDEL